MVLQKPWLTAKKGRQKLVILSFMFSFFFDMTQDMRILGQCRKCSKMAAQGEGLLSSSIIQVQ